MVLASIVSPIVLDVLFTPQKTNGWNQKTAPSKRVNILETPTTFGGFKMLVSFLGGVKFVGFHPKSSPNNHKSRHILVPASAAIASSNNFRMSCCEEKKSRSYGG